jgi:hypothetical protein
MPADICQKKQMTIFDFARLKRSQQELIIQETAVLFETYVEKETRVTVYYMPSFFIEVNTCLKKNKIIDIIPFRRGAKIEKEKDLVYKELHNVFLLVA